MYSIIFFRTEVITNYLIDRLIIIFIRKYSVLIIQIVTFLNLKAYSILYSLTHNNIIELFSIGWYTN